MKSLFCSLEGRAVSACLLGATLAASPAVAVEVDTELIILVDLSRSVSNAEFANTMESVAATFESSNVVSSITRGAAGVVATSLIFFAGADQQQVGISWTQISDSNSASQFSAAIRAATRPFRGRSAIGSAFSFATPTFGDETGGVANGFESSRQVVTLFADGRDDDTPTPGGNARRVRDARDAAVAAGVDEISAILLNTNNGSLENYFSSNVIGGDGSSTPAVTRVDPNAIDQESVTTGVGTALQGSPLVSIPEPSTLFLVVLSSVGLLSRRR